LTEEETQLPEKVELSLDEEPFDKTAGEAKTEAASVPQPPVQPIQTADTAQPEQAAPVRQIAAEKIISQITAQAAKADVSMIQMELNPKFLGRIHLVIEAAAGGLTAKLRSDNGAVRSLLGEHLVELKASLKEAGINMKEIEITEARVSTQLSDRRFQQNTAEQAGEQQTKIKGLTPITAAGQTEDAEPIITAYATGRVSGDSQFDYRA
jgi:flagellar hook-length control protein FliK